MAELFPIGLPEQIACVERELRLRRNVFARRVAEKRMRQSHADKEIAAMSAVLDTLLFVRDNGDPH